MCNSDNCDDDSVFDKIWTCGSDNCDDDSVFDKVWTCFLVFFCIVVCCCYVKQRLERRRNQAATQTRATTTEQPPATTNGEDDAENNAADPALRSKVLQAIFPEQTVRNSNHDFDANATSPPLNSYPFFDRLKTTRHSCTIQNRMVINGPTKIWAMFCARFVWKTLVRSARFQIIPWLCATFCLLFFFSEPGDVITSSHCSHTYHRDCILGWLQVKDECPNCRQQMWEPEAYQMLEEEVRAMELRASTKERSAWHEMTILSL